MVDNPAGTLNYGGVISGAGNLVQSGPGTLLLSAANTYTGGTTVSGGALEVGDSGTISGGVTDNASVILKASSGSENFTNVLSGSGSVSKWGSGTMVLGGANSYSGGTTVSLGILSVSTIADSGASNLSTGPVTLDGGTLSYTGSSAVTTIRPFYGTANGGTIQSSAALTLDGPYTGSIQSTLMKLGAGVLTLGGASPNTNLVLDAEAGTVDLAKPPPSTASPTSPRA